MTVTIDRSGFQLDLVLIQYALRHAISVCRVHEVYPSFLQEALEIAEALEDITLIQEV